MPNKRAAKPARPAANAAKKDASQVPPAAGGMKEHTPPTPYCRRLRVFSFDPAAGRSIDTLSLNISTIPVKWEPLEPGPAGEYVEVVDHDPASSCYYAPVDLEDSAVIATDGLAPAEGNPKFHQQMVYAVASRTIETFESALGRKVLWSPRVRGANDGEYVQRLRIYPHALREQNAYYNPLKKALLFGYFPSARVEGGTTIPGGMVFTCLSHDVVAHETAHAILDGVNRGLVEPTNRDMLAFHEAFADIIALFQHFSIPHLLEREIARVRGDLRDRNLLGELAQEFGQGTGLHGALRSYIGGVNPLTGQWERVEPTQTDYANARGPHSRGAVLVAAVFDTFLSIYERRIADLKRIASGGSGILREGELHPDLAARFAGEAATAAAHVLKLCVRGLDYCPPVDMNFGDFLRAVITADCEVFPEDQYGYRVALMESFRERGIYPRDIRTMSEDALRWNPPHDIVRHLDTPSLMRLRYAGDLIRRLSNISRDVSWPLEDRRYLHLPRPSGTKAKKAPARAAPAIKLRPREAIFHLLRQERGMLNLLWRDTVSSLDAPAREQLGNTLGLDLKGRAGAAPQFEVRALNFADRSEAGGVKRREAIVWLRQRRPVTVNGVNFRLEGGSTVIIDLDRNEIRYAVRKSVTSQERQQSAARFHAEGNPLVAAYLAGTPATEAGHRFAMVHSTDTEEESYG